MSTHYTPAVDVSIKGSKVYHIADVTRLGNGTVIVHPWCSKGDRTGKYRPLPEGHDKRLCRKCRMSSYVIK